MNLNFLGNGSGFSMNHTNSYFVKDNIIYIIDCSLLNLGKILNLNPQDYKKCIVLLTHLHDDHVSGLGLLIQKMFYIHNKKIYLYVPEALLNDVHILLNITGIPDNIYTNINEDNIYLNNFSAIPTEHTLALSGKCFGYTFDLNGKKIIYSGDTCTLEPYKKYIYENKNVEFYVDCSIFSGDVHLKYDDIEDDLIDIATSADVYIMHIDDEKEMLKRIKDKPLSIVEVI